MILLLSILIIKIFFFDAYFVASDSMKNTLLVGDFLIGSKASYKIKTPDFIPFTQIKIPSIELLQINKPKRNDIVVFSLSEFLSNPEYSNYEIIKRIVGLPGEVFYLSDKKIFINGNEVENFFTLENSSSNFKRNIFKEREFSYLKYGPIKIPSKGDTIKLNPKNIKFWQPIINFENKGKFISVEGTVITFKGKPISEYVLKNDYYFVLGDNLLNSVDSRIIGFVPECAIIAKVKLIYFSIEPNSSNQKSIFFDRLRLDRFLKVF